MRFTIVFLCLAMLSLPACSNGETENHADKSTPTVASTNQAAVAVKPAAVPRANGFLTVTPQQAQQLINTRQGLVMIDVRNPPELAEGVIKGSHNVPLWPVMKGQLNLPKDTPLLVICAVGGRSYGAGQALAKQWGFQEVYNLKGGINGWRRAGLPLQ